MSNYLDRLPAELFVPIFICSGNTNLIEFAPEIGRQISRSKLLQHAVYFMTFYAEACLELFRVFGLDKHFPTPNVPFPKQNFRGLTRLVRDSEWFNTIFTEEVHDLMVEHATKEVERRFNVRCYGRVDHIHDHVCCGEQYGDCYIKSEYYFPFSENMAIRLVVKDFGMYTDSQGEYYFRRRKLPDNFQELLKITRERLPQEYCRDEYVRDHDFTSEHSISWSPTLQIFDLLPQEYADDDQMRRYPIDHIVQLLRLFYTNIRDQGLAAVVRKALTLHQGAFSFLKKYTINPPRKEITGIGDVLHMINVLESLDTPDGISLGVSQDLYSVAARYDVVWCMPTWFMYLHESHVHALWRKSPRNLPRNDPRLQEWCKLAYIRSIWGWDTYIRWLQDFEPFLDGYYSSLCKGSLARRLDIDIMLYINGHPAKEFVDASTLYALYEPWDRATEERVQDLEQHARNFPTPGILYELARRYKTWPLFGAPNVPDRAPWGAMEDHHRLWETSCRGRVLLDCCRPDHARLGIRGVPRVEFNLDQDDDDDDDDEAARIRRTLVTANEANP